MRDQLSSTKYQMTFSWLERKKKKKKKYQLKLSTDN